MAVARRKSEVMGSGKVSVADHHSVMVPTTGDALHRVPQPNKDSGSALDCFRGLRCQRTLAGAGYQV